MDILAASLVVSLFGLLAWFRLKDAIAVLVFSLPVYIIRFSIGPFPTTLLELMILSLAAVWMVQGGVQRLANQWTEYGRKPLIRVLAVFIVIFFIAAIAGVVISPNRYAALGLFRAYWFEPLLVFLIIISTFRTKEEVVRLFGAFALSGSSIAAIALVQKFTGWNIPAPWIEERRVTSIYPYPNAVGLYLAPLIPLTIAYVWDRAGRTKKKLLWWSVGMASVFFMCAAIVLAKTEAALVALVVTAIFFGMSTSSYSRIITVVVTLCAVGGLILTPGISNDISRKLQLKDWSGKVRKSIWNESVAMLSDRGVLGVGIGGYTTAMIPYHKATHLEIFQYPHNLFLNFWTEVGALGLFAFLALVGWFWATLRRVGRSTVSYALAGSMTILLIHGLVDVPYFKNDLSLFFWFLMACATLTLVSPYRIKEE